MQTLLSKYTAEVDRINKSKWSDLLTRFDDATINQTWSYGSIRWGEANLSHLVLKKEGEIVAAVQLRIIKIPVFKGGIAYISWGPMWRVRGTHRNLECLRQMLKALRNEYSVRRGLLLRVLLNVFDYEVDSDEILSIFKEEEFQRKLSPYRTLLLDIEPSLDQLRNNLSKEWRKNLRKAESCNLKIMEGNRDEFYEVVSALYKEMRKRKGFSSLMDTNQFGMIQRDLPDFLKMRIMLCELDGEPVAALVGSAIGDIGIELVAATNNKALKINASYLLRWRMVQWLKDSGCRLYDLGGIDPEKNPGTYHFKAGLAGKSGKDTRYLGQFEACHSIISSFFVRIGDYLRTNSRKNMVLAEKNL